MMPKIVQGLQIIEEPQVRAQSRAGSAGVLRDIPVQDD